MQPVLTTSRECETAVLGSMLIDKTALNLSCSRLEPGDFSFPANASMFVTMQQMASEGKPVEMVSVTEELKKAGLLDLVGGAGYVVNTIESVGTAVNVEYYIGVVKDHALTRRFNEIAVNPDLEVKDKISLITQLGQASHPPDLKPKSISDLVPEYSKHVDARLTGKYKLLKTGFSTLDMRVGYWSYKQLCAVEAASGHGKTSLGLRWSMGFAENEHKVLFLSGGEMDTNECLDKMQSTHSRVNPIHIFQSRVGKEEVDRINEGIGKLMATPLYLLTIGGFSIDKIRHAVEQCPEKPDVLVLDHFQLFETVNNELQEKELRNIAYRLKYLFAEQMNMLVIITSQITFDKEKKSEWSQLCRSLEHACDKVFVLRDMQTIDDQAGIAQFDLHIKKNRQGFHDTSIRMEFNRQFNDFMEI